MAEGFLGLKCETSGAQVLLRLAEIGEEGSRGGEVWEVAAVNRSTNSKEGSRWTSGSSTSTVASCPKARR